MPEKRSQKSTVIAWIIAVLGAVGGILPERFKERLFSWILGDLWEAVPFVTIACIAILYLIVRRWKQWRLADQNRRFVNLFLLLCALSFWLGWTRFEGWLLDDKTTRQLGSMPIPCMFYNVTIQELEVVECPSEKCGGNLIYQFSAHTKRLDDTILTQSPGVNRIGLTIPNNVIKETVLAIRLDIKTIAGETIGQMKVSWNRDNRWGVGEHRFVDQNRYMLVMSDLSCKKEWV